MSTAIIEPSVGDKVHGRFGWLGRHWWRVLLLALVFAVVAFFTGRSLPLQFTVSTDLLPAQQQPSAGSAGLSAIAGLAGVNVNSSADEAQIGMAILRSRNFLGSFIAVNNLAPELLPGIPEGRRLTLLQQEQAFNAFRKRLTIIQDKVSGVIRIELKLRDPYTAAASLNNLVAQLNRNLRVRSAAHAGANRSFLEGELGRTQNLEMRQMISALTASELRTLMRSRQPSGVGFEVIDPAVTPATTSNIRSSILAIGGLVIGAFLGVLWGLISDALRQRT